MGPQSKRASTRRRGRVDGVCVCVCVCVCVQQSRQRALGDADGERGSKREATPGVDPQGQEQQAGGNANQYILLYTIHDIYIYFCKREATPLLIA
jgi:hypothetical protein